mmetsp:Transcript_2786/g.10712  ORF Transcript_2786/g.10712 Transcript_2786/m.10712 type:complete len:491 (-) Transcript_2786:215-1687(-)
MSSSSPLVSAMTLSPSTRKRTSLGFLWTGVYPYLDFTQCLKVRCTQRSSFHAFPFIAITKSHLSQNCSISALRMCYLHWVQNTRRNDTASSHILHCIVDVLAQKVHSMHSSHDANQSTQGLSPVLESSTNTFHSETPQCTHPPNHHCESLDSYIAFLREIVADEFSKDEGLLRIFFNRYWVIRFAAIQDNRPLLDVLLPYIPKCAPRPICNFVIQRACKHNWLDVVKILLPHVDLADRESLAFRWACEFGSLQVVQFLLTLLQESDPDLFQTSNLNHYALRYACRNSYGNIVILILNDNRLRSSAQPYSRKLLEFIFYESCIHGLSDVVDFLLDHTTVDPSLKSNAAFINACKNNHSSICKSLLRDPRVNPADKENAALKYAAQRGHTPVMLLLLDDPRIDPALGNNNVLRRACKHNRIEIVKQLLKRVKPDVSCLVAAVEAQNEDIAKLLIGDGHLESRDISSFTARTTKNSQEAIANLISRHRTSQSQ